MRNKKYLTMRVSDEFAKKMHAGRELAKKMSEVKPLNALANQGADFTQFCGPVPDQKEEGSCTAETARNHIWWKQNKYGYKPVTDPSVNAIYFFGRKIYGDLSMDMGSTIQDSYQGTVFYGVIPTINDLYGPDTLFTPPPLADVVFKCISKTQLATTTAAIRASLDAAEPVGISMAVMETLFYPVNGVVDVGPICPNEGHGQFVCGYKPDPQYTYIYKIQGSWGTDYGLNGFIYVTEAYLDQCLWEAFQLDIPPEPVVPTPPTPTPTTLVSVTINPYLDSTIQIGSTQTEKLTAKYSDGSDGDVTSKCTWISTNAAVANVSATGLITAISVGNCVIRASFTSGTNTLTAQVNVNVEAIPVPPTPPTPTPTYYVRTGSLTKDQADMLASTFKEFTVVEE